MSAPPMWSRRGMFRLKTISDEGAENGVGLQRSMGLWQLTALSLGGLVGAGVFSLSGVVAKQDAGPGVMLSFLIAILASGAAALCYAEFTSLIPQAGSAISFRPCADTAACTGRPDSPGASTH